MTFDKNELKYIACSKISTCLKLHEKSKLAIMKHILEKGRIPRTMLLSSIGESYYPDLPHGWVERSLDSLIESGLVEQDKDFNCTLSSPSATGKVFFEEQEEINQLLEKKWGAGDLHYLEPLWLCVARKIFVSGGSVERDELVRELHKDAEDRLGVFKDYSSVSEAKYTVIPRELAYMEEFGLTEQHGTALELPGFVIEFLFQDKETLFKEIQAGLASQRNEKEELKSKLSHMEKLYDLHKLKDQTIRMLSQHETPEKDELVNQLNNAYEQLQRMNCHDTIVCSGRAAEMLVARIFMRLRGEDSTRQITQMGNQLSKLWKTEVPGQITTPLEFVLSLLSEIKWLRDKKGAHSRDLTGFEPPTIDEARQTVGSVLLATKYAIEFEMLPK